MYTLHCRTTGAPLARVPGFGARLDARPSPPPAAHGSSRTGAAGSEGRPRAALRITRPEAATPRGFWSGQRGATTIGAALSISILVTAFAALMGIVHEIYVEDRMERGARAGARAVSLLAAAPASAEALERIVCDAVRRELWPGLAEGESDECTARWTVEVTAFPTPRALGDDAPRAAGSSPGGENEDMILVRLIRPGRGWLPVGRSAEADEGTAASTPGKPASTRIVAAALARNERAVVVAL